MKRVAHLSSAHPALDIRIFVKECCSLAKNGYKVFLIVPDSGEIKENKEVLVCPVSVPKNRFERMTKTVLKIYKKAKKINADVYHFHDPELIPVGILLKITGKTVIYDVHEDYPRQIMDKQWLPWLLRKPVSILYKILELLAGQLLDGIVAATPTIAKKFPNKKTVLVQNFPISGELFSDSQLDFSKRKPNVIYVGGLTVSRGLKEMIKAIALLSELSDLRLVLGGNFESKNLEDQVRVLPGWDKVDFKGWLSREEYKELLTQCIAGLVLFHPTGNNINSQPNKLFEYMSAGLPVIASDFPLWREFIEKNKCGLLVDPFDPHEISTAIKWIMNYPEEAELMGKRGQKAVFSMYNWSVEEKKLLQYYGKY